jgi:hypothetical protein
MKLPKNWNEITIKQYLAIHKILTDKEIDIVDRQVMVLSELLNVSEQYVEALNIDVFKQMVVDTKFLYEVDIDKRIPIDFEIDGVLYNFDPIKPIKKAGDFIDISHLTKESEEIIYNLHRIMAVLCKPKGEQSYEERCDLFYNKLTIDKAYPISLFFSTVFQNLLPHIQNSLVKENKKNLKKMEQMIAEEL